MTYYLKIMLAEGSFKALLSTILLLVFGGWFLGQTALIERPQASFFLGYETLRITLLLSLGLSIVHTLTRLQKTGEIQALLTLPISRSTLIVSLYGASVSLLGLLGGGLLIFLKLLLFLPWDIVGYGFLAFLGEGMIVIALAFFASMAFPHFFKSTLFLLALYGLGRFKALLLASLTSRWLDVPVFLKTIGSFCLSFIPNLTYFEVCHFLKYDIFKNMSFLETCHFFEPAPSYPLVAEILTSALLFVGLACLSLKKRWF